MNIKIGDKVKLTSLGYHFQHNIDLKLDCTEAGGEFRRKDLEGGICEMLAVQGTGTVLKFNIEGSPFVKWEWRNAGMYFYYKFHYNIDDVRKLTLWEKLCSFFN